MLHKEIPFLRIVLALCLGIISGLYIKPDCTFLVASGILIFSGFILSIFFNKYQVNLVYGVVLSVSFFLCGLLLYNIEKSSLSVFRSEKTCFAGTLSDYPEEKDNSFRLRVELNKIIKADKAESVKGSLILYNKKDSLTASLLPGDILIFQCTPVEITNRENPYEFDYRFFMENHGIKYYAFTKSSDFIKHTIPERRKLVHRALIVREKIIGMFRERGISGERLALAAAITLGQKNMLDPDQKLYFSKAGVMHIMAVSGLHAVIVSLFVYNLLFFMKRRFIIPRIIITIVILWAFAFVTGLTSSVLRATLMFSFLQAGKLLKRPANGINSVLASASFLIIMRPSVIFDAGFLLSYSAVIYIIYFYNDFYQLLHFENRLSDKIWQSSVVTIVAQAGTLPLTIMLFNRFPTYFILANITIVPVANLLIITGCLIPIFYHINFLSQFLAHMLNYLTGLTESLTIHAASLPYSTIENIGLPAFECILLSVTIFLFLHWILKKRSFSIFFPALFLMLYVFSGTIRDISSKTTNELIIYNTPGSTSIGIRTGKVLNLFSDTAIAPTEVRRHCATLGLKLKSTVLLKTHYCIRAGMGKILITNFLTGEMIQNTVPDFVVLSGRSPGIENSLNLADLQGTVIIVSEAVPNFRILQRSMNSGISKIHFVKKSGAFIKRI